MHITNHGLMKYAFLVTQTQQGKQKSNEVNASERQRTSESSASQPDAVELSTLGRDIQRTKTVLQEGSDVRESRVAEVTRALANGNLNLNGQDIASKLLLDPGHNPNADS